MCAVFAVIWLLFLVGIALAIAEGRLPCACSSPLGKSEAA